MGGGALAGSIAAASSASGSGPAHGANREFDPWAQYGAAGRRRKPSQDMTNRADSPSVKVPRGG